MKLTIQPEKLSIDRAAQALGLEDRSGTELFGIVSAAMSGPACAMFEELLKQERDLVITQFMDLDATEFAIRAAGLQGYLNGLNAALFTWTRMASWAKQRPTKEQK